MATKAALLGYFLLIYTNLSVCQVFESIFDDVSSCKEVCHNTYTPHTYEKSGSEECCNRGCRLFSMMEFIHDDVNQTKEMCIASCQEAYTDQEDFDACSLGCKSQKPFALESLLKDNPFEQSLQSVNPLMFLHSWTSGLMSHVMNQASLSWSVYMKDGDGSIIVVKSPPAVRLIEIQPLDIEEEYNTASYMETNIEPIDNSATPFLKNSAFLSQRNDDDIIDLSARDLTSSRGSRGDEAHTDWLSCVATKTGLPRLLLSWLLLMCSIVMIWLCLSAAVTAPEQKIFTEPQKLSINGDQEVIAQLLASGIKPQYPQEKLDVAALPIKISVQRI